MMKKIDFNVTGMSCEHCVATVEKAVVELEGVKKVKVNLKKEKATVKFDESCLTTHAIISAIEAKDFHAEVM